MRIVLLMLSTVHKQCHNRVVYGFVPTSHVLMNCNELSVQAIQCSSICRYWIYSRVYWGRVYASICCIPTSCIYQSILISVIKMLIAEGGASFIELGVPRWVAAGHNCAPSPEIFWTFAYKMVHFGAFWKALLKVRSTCYDHIHCCCSFLG